MHDADAVHVHCIALLSPCGGVYETVGTYANASSASRVTPGAARPDAVFRSMTMRRDLSHMAQLRQGLARA